MFRAKYSTHFSSEIERPTISVGQALLLLIEKHQHDVANFNELKKLYFLGAVDAVARQKIDEWLKDDLLKKYKVSADCRVIDEDPTRRYFETHLAYETLLTNPMKDIEIETLEKHYQSIREIVSHKPDVLNYVEEIFRGDFKNVKDGVTTDLLCAKEYCDILKKLESKEDYSDFSPDYKKKMYLLAKSSYLCLIAFVNDSSNKLPLGDLYRQGFFVPEKRGKVVKDSKEQHEVKSCHQGLMKSYMPVPKGDITHLDTPSTYLRVADRNKFNPESKWAKESFSHLVHPFSCSISGTMLFHFKVFKHLDNQNIFLFKNIDKFRNYLKCFVSLLMFNSGGHTFYEFLYPIVLPEIQESFDFMRDDKKCFKQINCETLFMNGNEKAFDKALINTINYNHQILKRAFVRQELVKVAETKSAPKPF